MTRGANRVDAAEDIVPRNLRFGVRENADRAWFGGDPVLSAVFDGFAVMLPEGERFFIRSLRAYLPGIEDPALREAIHAFGAQEAFHTREHEAYNDAIRDFGHDVDAMEARSASVLGAVKSPAQRLFATCAMEQLTFALARFILKRPALMDQAAPAYRRLWRWHALEEIEHSAVALRVMRAVDLRMPAWRRYLNRVMVLNIVILRMFGLAVSNMETLLGAKDGKLGWRLRSRLAWVLLGRPGFAYALIMPYLAYLRPGYAGGGGPVEAALLAEGRRLLEQDPPQAAPPLQRQAPAAAMA